MNTDFDRERLADALSQVSDLQLLLNDMRAELKAKQKRINELEELLSELSVGLGNALATLRKTG